MLCSQLLSISFAVISDYERRRIVDFLRYDSTKFPYKAFRGASACAASNGQDFVAMMKKEIEQFQL